MKNVLGIGNALVDVLKILPDDGIISSLGFSRGSMNLVDAETSRSIKENTGNMKTSLAAGGSAANTMHGLAMMGMDAGYIGAVGRDETGDLFEADMRSAGVNTYLLRKKMDTGTAVALVSPDSERTFATHLGAAVDLKKKDIKANFFTGYDFLYMEGYLITNKDLVVSACRSAKKMGIKVAVDLASYNVVDSFRDDFQDVVRDYVDIIFANEEEAKAFTGKDPEDSVHQLSKLCEIAVVKIGKEGSLIKRADELIRVEAIDATSRDTTGAGDLYAAGFLYGLCNNEELDKCGVYGSILAGNVIEVIGPKMDAARWKKIKGLVSEIQQEN